MQKVWRGLAIITAVIVSFFAGVHAFVLATRAANPETALLFDRRDAVAMALNADGRWSKAVVEGITIDVAPVARQSLGRFAANPRALRLLGYDVDAHGDHELAERLNQLAVRLSRRETAAQLWRLEASVEKNELTAILECYDILLRTNTNIRAQLYARLLSALSDPEIRNEFIPYIRKAPVWLPGLIDHARTVSNPDDLSSAIRQAGGLPKTTTYQSLAAGLLNQLFVKERFAEAAAFYASLPNSDIRILTSTAFSNAQVDSKFAPATWSLESSSSVGAVFGKSGESNIIRAYALPGASGIAAYKFLFMRPGVYRLSSAQIVTTPSGNSNGTWAVRCYSAKGQFFVHESEIVRSGKGVVLSQPFFIPMNCITQRLELKLNGGDDSAGLELNVQSIKMTH
jgi:hypothetical protein